MIKKVVIVGVGEVAKKAHLPAYRRIKCSKLVAVCDINKEAAEKTARSWNIPHYYTSLEACLKEEAPDLVDICTPPNSHLPLILQALKAGSHVIVEKPLVTSLSECEEVEKLYQAFRGRGLRIGVIHNWLFEFFLPIISSIVKSGELGEIQRIEVDIFDRQDDPMISNPNHWCHSIIGGRIGECLIHPVYILQHYLGTLKVTHVSVSKRGQYPWVAFDELFATLKSSDGKLAHIYITFNSPRADFPVILILMYNPFSLGIFGHISSTLRTHCYHYFFLPLPISKVAEPLHFLASLYRRFMFKATKRLPFNENWLREYEK